MLFKSPLYNREKFKRMTLFSSEWKRNYFHLLLITAVEQLISIGSFALIFVFQKPYRPVDTNDMKNYLVE